MSMENFNSKLSTIVKQIKLVIGVFVLTIVISIFYFLGFFDVNISNRNKSETTILTNDSTEFWLAPDINSITDGKQKDLVLYGKELIVHTSKYLGPKGSVSQISNGMNCQNCHMEAGTKIFGNNYGSVAANYPKYRARSGKEEDIYKRVNDCFERSLNGNSLDTFSKEMQAIKAYIEFLGSNVEKGKKAEGSGFKDLAFLDRAADPKKGKEVYVAKCQTCHQANGEGVLNADGIEYSFPPLWGDHAYNDKAGLFRLSNFAKYAKYNMPLGTSHENPQLTDEEAWDLAAFVNSQIRPTMETMNDWPQISEKPIDHPFGPFSDEFSEVQHKYGPFKPIKNKKDEKKKSA
jgi:thiosulfate dehydrogenase